MVFFPQSLSTQQVLDRTVGDADFTNSAAENTLYTYTVPAGTLGTNRALRLTLICDYLNDSGAVRTFAIRIKYGSTTIYDDNTNTIANGSSRLPVYIEFTLAANNATNAQVMQGYLAVGDPGGTTAGMGDFADDEIPMDTNIAGSAAEDSTTSLALVVTVQVSANTATQSFKRHVGILELI